MTADGKTVLVEGLPTDILEDRLADKLSIHFLRNRNGGGEITNITFPEESPGTALITFEENEVAQRVCRMRTHMLSVDEKKYEVQVSMHCTEVNPDETGDPNPGNPYKGGQFQGFLPATAKGNELLRLLIKAFNQGLTFKIKTCDSGDTVTWGQIPHKTKMEGGKSASGYPDASYLVHLTEVLKMLGIE